MRLAGGLWVCFAAVLFAQDPAPTFRAGVSLVRVDAEVTDGTRSITGLRKEDFLVYDNGEPRALTHLSRDELALDLIVLFDISGSMKPGVERVAAGAREALAHLRPGDRVAVMVFSTRLRMVLDFSQDLREVEDAVRQDVLRMNFRGGTYLRESIFHAGRHFRDQPRGDRRRAILVVTDNRGQQIGSNENRIISALWEADAVVGGLILKMPDEGVRLGPVTVRRRGVQVGGPRMNAGMDRIAEETGGELLKSGTPGPHFRDLLQRMRERYTLYYPMPDGRPGEARHVRVELTSEARRRFGKAQVRARKGYRLPGAEDNLEGPTTSASRF